MSWEQKPQVKLGNLGEKIIHQYLCEKNYTIFTPTSQNAHPCDGIVFKNQKMIFLYDVKTKGKTNQHNAQGFDKKKYDTYQELMNKLCLPFLVFFVDNHNGEVHCVNLKKDIAKEYIKIKSDGSIIGWNVNDLDLIGNVSQNLINESKDHTTRNHPYMHNQQKLKL
tara:strand:+ start:1096 stop:1593 length:498 start_codon:yes stop_codon:yes gene_type:complete